SEGPTVLFWLPVWDDRSFASLRMTALRARTAASSPELRLLRMPLRVDLMLVRDRQDFVVVVEIAREHRADRLLVVHDLLGGRSAASAPPIRRGPPATPPPAPPRRNQT